MMMMIMMMTTAIAIMIRSDFNCMVE